MVTFDVEWFEVRSGCYYSGDLLYSEEKKCFTEGMK
jgi:hypothetical protein